MANLDRALGRGAMDLMPDGPAPRYRMRSGDAELVKSTMLVDSFDAGSMEDIQTVSCESAGRLVLRGSSRTDDFH